MQNMRRELTMSFPARAVIVKKLPVIFNVQQERMFLRELEGCLTSSRPSLVLDCSAAHQVDRPTAYLLLCCLEEAMKRNGDVRLAAVRPEAEEMLKSSGIDRLFRVFETVAEAIDSFQQPLLDTGSNMCADDGRAESAEHAA
jgi:anti-anti-sigma regulatory factor